MIKRKSPAYVRRRGADGPAIASREVSQESVGAARERAATVEWLRGIQLAMLMEGYPTPADVMESSIARRYADAIERGDHLK